MGGYPKKQTTFGMPQKYFGLAASDALRKSHEGFVELKTRYAAKRAVVDLMVSVLNQHSRRSLFAREPNEKPYPMQYAPDTGL